MKKVNFIIFSLITLACISCKKSDDSVPLANRSKALLGQWEYEAITTDSAVDINGDGTVNIDLFNTQEIRQCIKDNLTFFTERGVNEKGHYSINDNGFESRPDRFNQRASEKSEAFSFNRSRSCSCRQYFSTSLSLIEVKMFTIEI